MKTSDKKSVKDFDAVEFMRQQRDKLSSKLVNMTKAEIVAYFKKREAELKIKPCA